jgi:hypothetical protein
MRVVSFAACYSGAVFAVGFVLGVLRVTLAVPAFGERIAELAEMPFMMAASVLVSLALVRRWRFDARRALAGGALALVLLLCVELTVAWLLRGLGPREYVLGRDPVSGAAYAVALAVFTLAPAFAARRAR